MNSMVSVLLSLFVLIPVSARAESIEDHKKELKLIVEQTRDFEKKLQDLQARKAQARVGPELEAVLTDIANLHKNTLELRRNRNVLKEHLTNEHPDSPLLLDKNLYTSFSKNAKAKGPLDDRLENLLVQMQSQYARTATKEAEAQLPKPEVKKVVAPLPTLSAETSKVHEKTKEEMSVEAKKQYLRDHIKAEMKISAPLPTPEEAAKAKEREKEKAKHPPVEKEKAQAAPAPAHH